MANATAAKGRRRRRKGASTKSSGTTWPWILALVGTAGAILAYENAATLRRWMPASLASSLSVPAIEQRHASPARPVLSEDVVSPSVLPLQKPALPPMPLAKTGEERLVGKGYSGTFYFCGTSGLDNCVASGDLFWFKKQAIRLADISAPRTEDAGCAMERDKGFAAKVRLRDLLNAGSFELVDWPNRDDDGRGRKLRVVVRAGHSLGAQMIGEGLVHAAGQAGKPWC
jgi:endonuclease YncB( thermonuclease family)